MVRVQVDLTTLFSVWARGGADSACANFKHSQFNTLRSKQKAINLRDFPEFALSLVGEGIFARHGSF